MTRRLPTLLRSSPRLAVILLLAIFLTSICTTPSEVHAKRGIALTTPGDDGGPAYVPGQGDDDQPTADGDGVGSRRIASVGDQGDAEPAGGSSERRFTSLRIAKNLIVRSMGFVKRLVGFIP
jgi:hypothetical protein